MLQRGEPSVGCRPGPELTAAAVASPTQNVSGAVGQKRKSPLRLPKKAKPEARPAEKPVTAEPTFGGALARHGEPAGAGSGPGDTRSLTNGSRPVRRS